MRFAVNPLADLCSRPRQFMGRFLEPVRPQPIVSVNQAVASTRLIRLPQCPNLNADLYGLPYTLAAVVLVARGLQVGGEFG